MRIALDSISQKEIMQRAQNIVTRILNSKILNVVIYTLHRIRINKQTPFHKTHTEICNFKIRETIG